MDRFKKEAAIFAGALLCCFLWGSAFPCIKIGYKLWNIDGGDTWRIIRFAGVRFVLAGLLVIVFASISRRKLLLPKRAELPKIMWLSAFQTIGQYVLFYLGLAHSGGVSSAVVDSLTTFFAIMIAALFMHMERLTARKILGCLLGFAGVVVINLSPQGFSFSPLGDGLVALSALCYGVSSNLIKRYSQSHDTVIFSGYQFIFGGIVMTLLGHIGLMGSGQSAAVSAQSIPKAVAMLVYLALVSSVAYTLWGLLLKGSDVSKISIFGFMTPVMGVVLSAVMLGEAQLLGIKHLIALALIAAGITAVNLKPQQL
ncbi:MAG: DMT family transporter [Ruminococcus sp.]|nr:DMT family transporter [Ruminococcus sp.]MBQ3988297.1 DMT family transporter [Ruminococcus sp.]